MTLVPSLIFAAAEQPFAPYDSAGIEWLAVIVGVISILVVAAAVFFVIGTVITPSGEAEYARAAERSPEKVAELDLLLETEMEAAGDDPVFQRYATARHGTEIAVLGRHVPRLSFRMAALLLAVIAGAAGVAVLGQILVAGPASAARDAEVAAYESARGDAIHEWALETYGVTAGADELTSQWTYETAVIADGVAVRVTLEYIDGIPVLMQDSAGGIELPRLDTEG